MRTRGACHDWKVESGNHSRPGRLAAQVHPDRLERHPAAECRRTAVARDARSAIARGDIPGISCVIIGGEVRVGRSRNTPLATRLAAISGAAGVS